MMVSNLTTLLLGMKVSRQKNQLTKKMARIIEKQYRSFTKRRVVLQMKDRRQKRQRILRLRRAEGKIDISDVFGRKLREYDLHCGNHLSIHTNLLKYHNICDGCYQGYVTSYGLKATTGGLWSSSSRSL